MADYGKKGLVYYETEMTNLVIINLLNLIGDHVLMTYDDVMQDNT